MTEPKQYAPVAVSGAFYMLGAISPAAYRIHLLRAWDAKRLRVADCLHLIARDLSVAGLVGGASRVLEPFAPGVVGPFLLLLVGVTSGVSCIDAMLVH